MKCQSQHPRLLNNGELCNENATKQEQIYNGNSITTLHLCKGHSLLFRLVLGSFLVDSAKGAQKRLPGKPNWTTLKPGTNVPIGTLIRTKTGSGQATLSQAGKSITLGPDETAQLTKPQKKT